MEFHLKGETRDISKYVLCPGSQERAQRIAEHFNDMQVVSEARGIVVYTGFYQGIRMTACGTGMGGPAVAIATEELGHLGADTFIRVGSCGVFQPGQKPGDVIIASGTVRRGGAGLGYLPVEFPAVPSFDVTRALVDAATNMKVPVCVGIGTAGDSFYGIKDPAYTQKVLRGGPVFKEMESDTLFLVGAVRGWRTGAIFASDGSPEEIKPDWGRDAFKNGEGLAIKVALQAMHSLAMVDRQKDSIE